MSQFRILLWRWEHAGIGKSKRVSGIAVSYPKLQIMKDQQGDDRSEEDERNDRGAKREAKENEGKDALDIN
jgi:hypothetical protein